MPSVRDPRKKPFARQTRAPKYLPPTAEVSQRMRSVRTKNTSPEMLLRRRLHLLGVRYVLHVQHLPGKPDIVFPKFRAVVFIHGCFWHRHEGCSRATTPKSNAAFWNYKFGKNLERDRVQRRLLTRDGWRVKVVWECRIERNVEREAETLRQWLQARLLDQCLERGAKP
jgi:DNA mismatch endonuclease, patch repair protein